MFSGQKSLGGRWGFDTCWYVLQICVNTELDAHCLYMQIREVVALSDEQKPDS